MKKKAKPTEVIRIIPRGLGVGLPWQNHEINAAALDESLDALSPAWDWWYDWKFNRMGRVGYFPMLWRCSRMLPEYQVTFDQAIVAAQIDPGRLWFLGNEPEKESQSNTNVHAFGKAAKRFKQLLPDTPIALPGVMVTMLDNDPGLYWLAGYKRLCDQGRAVVPDYLHVHIYAYVWEQWRDTLNRVRKWTRDAGWPDLLIVTEAAYAGDNSVTPESVAGNLVILDRVKKAVKVSDVRAAAWMSSRWHDWPGPASDLLTPSGQLTAVGTAFKQP